MSRVNIRNELTIDSAKGKLPANAMRNLDRNDGKFARLVENWIDFVTNAS